MKVGKWFSLLMTFSVFLIDFGELSKKLAEVWKQLPEKDKLVNFIKIAVM